jgi:hypothetical protein
MKQYGRYPAQGGISAVRFCLEDGIVAAVYHNRIKTTKRLKQAFKPMYIWDWFKKKSHQETKAQWLRILSL